MQLSTTSNAPGISSRPGLWKHWQGYLVRWLMFGVVVELFQPVVNDMDQYWLQKLQLAVFGLFFGAVCAVAFTLAQNTLNVARVKWKSWSIVIATWMAVKFVLVSVMTATSACLAK